MDFLTLKFENMLRSPLDGSSDFSSKFQVLAVQSAPLENQNGIVSVLMGSKTGPTGHRIYSVHWRDGSKTGVLKIVGKIRGSDQRGLEHFREKLNRLSPQLALAFDMDRPHPLTGIHIRELAFNKMREPVIQKLRPRVFGTESSAENGTYEIFMECFEGGSFLNAMADNSKWSSSAIHAALAGIAQLHGRYLEDFSHVEKQGIVNRYALENNADSVVARKVMLEYCLKNSLGFLSGGMKALLLKMLEDLAATSRKLAASPLTLCHYDFNPRNLFLKSKKGRFELCLYDWEVATVHVPQRDVCEFVASVIPQNSTIDSHLECIEFYRKSLNGASNLSFTRQAFMEIYILACVDFALSKIIRLGIVNGVTPLSWFPRYVGVHLNFLSQARNLQALQWAS